MCLILATNKVDALLDKITNKELLAAATRNDDGVGVMYLRKEDHEAKAKLIVEKMTPQNASPAEVVDFLMHHATQANVGPFASHLRLTTDGSSCDQNTHPYQITSIKEGHGKDIWMMHNGVLNFCRGGRKYDPEDKDSKTMSDTAIFAHDFLRPILAEKPSLLFNTGFQAMVAQTISTGNKLCFMDDTGKIVIINKGAGGIRKDEEGNEVWMSSPHYLTVYTPPVNTGGSYYKQGGSQNSGTSNFRKDTETKTSGTTSQTQEKIIITLPGRSTVSTNKVLTVDNQNEIANMVKETLKTMNEQTKKQLQTGSANFKSEPDIENPEFRKEMAELRTFLKDYPFEELAEYVIDCPEECASLLYLFLNAYTYHTVDKEYLDKAEKVQITKVPAA